MRHRKHDHHEHDHQGDRGPATGPASGPIRVGGSGIGASEQAISPIGPPMRLGWRARRALKAEAEAAAAREMAIEHARRRARQVASFRFEPTPSVPVQGVPEVLVPQPRSAPDDARPPWRGTVATP